MTMPDDQLRAIGRITVNFGRAEIMMGGIMMALSGIPFDQQAQGQVIMSQLPFGKTLVIVETLVRLRFQ